MARRRRRKPPPAVVPQPAVDLEQLLRLRNSAGVLVGEYVVGPVETKVRSDVGALVTAHPMGEALSEMAYSLARTLDQGAGLAVAAVNRELRANLVELARLGVDGDDDFENQLSTPVRDEEEP